MFLLKGGKILTPNGYQKVDILIDRGCISKIDTEIDKVSSVETLNITDLLVVPGFVDAHVHLREPGFFYKESILTGTLCAASAGYTAVMPMPNLNPVPDSVENLKVELDIIKRDAKIKVYPYGAITVGQKGEEVADLEGMAKDVIGFSDDGHGVQKNNMMKEAMLIAKRLNKPIVAHCEDNTLLEGGYIHKGQYAKTHGHKGICSESEWKQVERDIELVRETGVQYHVCHVSTKESVQLIRKAKAEGVNITAETAPHYLVLTEDDLQENGRFKMNPPVREEADRRALIEGVRDGVIDIISTDHAPHSDEEKSKGLEKSAFGVIGLDTAFPVLYTKLVETGELSLSRLIEAMSVRPREIFKLDGGKIEEGAIADLAILDLNEQWQVKGKDSFSKGSATPFEGWVLDSKNVYTILNGEIIWKSQTRN